MLRNILWLLAAMIACLSALLVNGLPLFYSDTFAYLNRGAFLINIIAEVLGVDASASVSSAVADTSAEAAKASERVLDGKPAVGERTISASRSRAFSFTTGIFASLQMLEAMIVLHAALVLVAVWLPVRVAARHFESALATIPTVALSVIIASIGSLPFYVAYLMPDIYAPVGLLMIAVLTIFARQMTRWEILLACALGCLVVTAHITHLATAAVSIPVVAVISLMFGRAKWWLAPLLISLITAFGFVELSTYRVAVKAKTNLEAVFMPFITARLIGDRVGYDYLERNCPDTSLATCDLFDALSKSDNPRRLTASHIMFRSSAELGSFLHLSEDQRKAITEEQITFLTKVMLELPLRTTGAFLANTFQQARMNSVNMTLTTSKGAENLIGLKGLAFGEFGNGRLTRDTFWLEPVTKVHNALYIVSLVVIAVMTLWPGALPAQMRGFVIVILLGILANAFLCGGLSQPATRYGARVIWLLPLVASLCVLHSSFLVDRRHNRVA